VGSQETVFLGFMWKGGKWRNGYKGPMGNKEIRVLGDWGNMGNGGLGKMGKGGLNEIGTF